MTSTAAAATMKAIARFLVGPNRHFSMEFSFVPAITPPPAPMSRQKAKLPSPQTTHPEHFACIRWRWMDGLAEAAGRSSKP